MSEFLVTFDRVGRNHNVPPLTVEADSGNRLAEAIYRYAKPHLLSRDVDVSVDLETGKGQIYCGFNNGGTFIVESVSDGDQS